MSKKIDRVLLPRAGRGKVKSLEILKAFPMGSLVSLIGEDVKKQLGHPVQGIVIKDGEAKKILTEAKGKLDDGDIENLFLTVGVSGKDMILVANAGSAWEKFAVLVANYTDILAKQKQTPEGVVVNLDPGDKVIDKAAVNMGNKFGTEAVTKKEVGDKIGGMKSGNIVLLAHGDEDKTSSGQIYGKDFAGKSASDIVALLVKNKDVNKRLHPDYSGTVYLDGCFTAQGGAMKNYTQDVWNKLKSAGIKNVKVMGNLGAAATDTKGDEIVNPTIESEEFKKKISVLQTQLLNITDICDKRMLQIRLECGQKGTSATDNPEFKVLAEKKKLANQKYEVARSTLLSKAPVDVKNLVGKFGLSTVN